jgi:hypothetical protein
MTRYTKNREETQERSREEKAENDDAGFPLLPRIFVTSDKDDAVGSTSTRQTLLAGKNKNARHCERSHQKRFYHLMTQNHFSYFVIFIMFYLHFSGYIHTFKYSQYRPSIDGDHQHSIV